MESTGFDRLRWSRRPQRARLDGETRVAAYQLLLDDRRSMQNH